MAFCDSDKPVLASKEIRIGIVVGEASGDILGVGLMRALKDLYPNIHFEGIGGPRMLAEGFHSLYAQDRLAVMGLIEPLARLPELLSIRRNLRKHFISNPPAVFVGIDSPDFNLSLELALKRSGIPTAHYVSPSVWAWRQGRIKKIAKAVDLMLTLFPFEAVFYQEHNVPVKFVGHPLADQIAMEPNQAKAISILNLADFTEAKTVVALMPGSRSGEVERMGTLFLEVAQCCLKERRDLVFLTPSASAKRYEQIEELLLNFKGKLPIKIIEGQSHLVMAASDVVVMASGTTTLEAMLLKRPMVIAYKVAAFSYWLFSKLVKVKYIGLPNLLIGKGVVPEFIQHNAQPQAIAEATLEYLNDKSKEQELKAIFTDQHIQLKQKANEQAAKAIFSLIKNK